MLRQGGPPAQSPPDSSTLKPDSEATHPGRAVHLYVGAATTFSEPRTNSTRPGDTKETPGSFRLWENLNSLEGIRWVLSTGSSKIGLHGSRISSWRMGIVSHK